MTDAVEWVDGAQFHSGSARTYTPPPDLATPAALVKHRAWMAHVTYTPAHPSPGAPGWLAGAGSARTVWLASEQPGTAEGTHSGGLLAAFDTELDPGASIGWHVHDHSEEMYVLIAGELTVRVGTRLADADEFELRVGDVHQVPCGWGHAARAGASGARMLVFEWEAS